MNDDKYTLLIGRWSPFHEGHKYMVDSFLNNGKKVCIAIRDTPISKEDPFSNNKRMKMIRKIFSVEVLEKKLKIIIVPDLETVAVGRKVGYSIVEVPENIKVISGTKTRAIMKDNHQDLDNKQVIWFWGLVSSGKSTLTKKLYDYISSLGVYKVKLIDSDNFRKSTGNKDFSDEGRTRNINELRREAQNYFNDGFIVIVAAMTPFKQMRVENRKLFGYKYFEISTNCSLIKCRQRDTKGIYRKYDNHEISNVSGLDGRFDYDTTEDIAIGTSQEIAFCFMEIKEGLIDQGIL